MANPFWPGSQYDRQSRRAIISADIGQWDGILPNLLATDAFPGGQKGELQKDWPNPSFAAVTRRAYVANIAASLGQYATPLPLELQKDVFFRVAGLGPEYDYPNPNLGKPRARDYSITAGPNPLIVTPTTGNPGAQSYDNPPKAAQRARDYTIAASFPLELIAQDAMVSGQASQDLPPKSPARARDYSIGESFPFELIGQDQTNASTPTKVSQDLPPRPASRARDYTFTNSYTLELIGKDAFNPGVQISGNAPAGTRRAVTLGDPGCNFLIGLTSVTPTIPAGQSTAASENPSRSAARSRDYSIAVDFPPTLIAQDTFYGAPGMGPDFDWPNPRLSPIRVASIAVGADALPLLTFTTALPVGAASQDANPRAATRSRDYTWLQSAPIHQITQLPVGDVRVSGTLPPPKSKPRLSDYSITNSFPLELIGKDRIYGAPGQVVTYDWQLPPRSATRARDYTQYTVDTLRVATATTRDITLTLTRPEPKWSTTEPSGRWSMLEPSPRWHTTKPQQ